MLGRTREVELFIYREVELSISRWNLKVYLITRATTTNEQETNNKRKAILKLPRPRTTLLHRRNLETTAFATSVTKATYRASFRRKLQVTRESATAVNTKNFFPAL